MPKFKVEIQTSIWGKVVVEAKNKDEAYEVAHEEFNYTDPKHHFEQETMSVEEIK